jgi:menaquinone-dependent protoporphyrinogen oxidase
VRTLIVYASTHGHTAKIAARLAEVLEAEDHRAEVHDVASATGLRLADYDAVVAGASIHIGHHQKGLVDWAERHAQTLNVMPSAFFSVCLTAAEDSDESREATAAYLDDFEKRTGWAPGLRIAFAGALQYREYDFATRLLVRLLMKRQDRPTDASRDYDYTDWAAVEGFARACATMTAGAARA